jgi:hypothetical protein
MVERSDWEESIKLKGKYEGVEMILNELIEQVNDRQIDTKEEFLDLLLECKEDYLGTTD